MTQELELNQQAITEIAHRFRLDAAFFTDVLTYSLPRLNQDAIANFQNTMNRAVTILNGAAEEGMVAVTSDEVFPVNFDLVLRDLVSAFLEVNYIEETEENQGYGFAMMAYLIFTSGAFPRYNGQEETQQDDQPQV
jgi:hypothetical protein